MSREAWPELPSHRLPDLAKWAKIPDDDTHRALADSRHALHIFIEAVSTIGQKVRWDWPEIDWRMQVRYNKAASDNHAFCVETRPLETADPALAVTRYVEAMVRMYEYETLVDGRNPDAYILDRLTLCFWKLGRYAELVESVDEFSRKFPEIESGLMTAVLKRKERAVRKLAQVAL